MTANRTLPVPVAMRHPASPEPVELNWTPAHRCYVRWRVEIREIEFFASVSDVWQQPKHQNVVDAYGTSRGLCDESQVGLLIDIRA